MCFLSPNDMLVEGNMLILTFEKLRIMIIFSIIKTVDLTPWHAHKVDYVFIILCISDVYGLSGNLQVGKGRLMLIRDTNVDTALSRGLYTESAAILWVAIWKLFWNFVYLADPDLDEPPLIEGDIAVRSDSNKNADPCTSRGCLWNKWSDGKAYIPYYIANHFCKDWLPFLESILSEHTA